MFELLVFTVGAAVVGFLLIFFLFKALIWLVSVPIHLGFFLVKLVFGLVIGIPLAIVGFVVCAVVLPVAAAILPVVLLVLAIPLMLVAAFFGFLKLVF